MCIIYYNETGKLYDKESLSTSYDNNPHGVGLMWVEDGKMQTMRGLMTKAKMFEVLGHFEGVPHALHLRWRTRGKITKELCHPFRASHEGAGPEDEVYMMHNGTFSHIRATGDVSDTHVFAQNMQGITKEFGTDMLFNESFLRRVEKDIKSLNKVIFLRSDGKVAIMNPSQWTVLDGIWLSNTYSLQKGYRQSRVGSSLAGKWSGWTKTGTSKYSRSYNSSAQPKKVKASDWLSKSKAWEDAQKTKSHTASSVQAGSVQYKLQEKYEEAYKLREKELGRKLSKKEMKKTRRAVRLRREQARERFEALVDSHEPSSAQEPSAQSARPGRVVRRRQNEDGSYTITPVR